MEISEGTRSTKSPRQTRGRGRIACKQCRQAKYRCGLGQIPCPRCKRYGLDCTVDPTYKRSNKSGRLQELEDHVVFLQDQVKKQRGKRSLPSSSIASSPSSSNVNAAHGRLGISEQESAGTTSATMISSQSPDCPATYSLGTVVLTQSQAEELFFIYFDEYHHLLPMLEPNRAALDYYSSSQLLFWSIIAVAARQYRKDVDLLDRVSQPLNDLLWKEASKDQTTLGIIQALILVSKWPFLNLRMSNDRSIILINIALTAAMRMGMHRRGREVDYSKEQVDMSVSVRTEWTRTWLSAVISSQILSIDAGQLQLFSIFDWTARSVCKRTVDWDVPEELRHNLMIQECSHFSMRSLSDNLDHPYGLLSEADFYSMMLQLEQKFDDLETTLDSTISTINRFRLYVARMYLEAMYFLYDSPQDLRKSGVMKAFVMAQKVIIMIISDSAANDILAHSSLVTSRMIHAAGEILFRVVHSSYRSDIDYENARILFNAAAFSLHQLSVQHKEKPLPILAAEVMREIWKLGENEMEMLCKPPTLIIKSRMGSSIVYDTLRIFLKPLRSRMQSRQESSRPHVTRSIQSQKEPMVNDAATPLGNFSTSSSPPSPQWSGMKGNLEFASNLDLLDASWMDDLGYFNMLDT